MRYSTKPGEPPRTGTVLEVDPPRVLGLSWGDDVLGFELNATSSGEGCRLVFTHVFDDLAGAAGFASGWDACLSVLATWSRFAGRGRRRRWTSRTSTGSRTADCGSGASPRRPRAGR